MPRGATVIRYEAARGASWQIKFRDADGRQVKRPIGREADGVTRKDAEAAGRAAVVNVESKEWRKPPPLTFRKAVADWYDEQKAEKGWRPTTMVQYRSIRDRLEEEFGPRRLADLRPSDVTAWAVVTERIDRNPATGVPHPRAAQRKGKALTPQEVQALTRAFEDDQEARVRRRSRSGCGSTAARPPARPTHSGCSSTPNGAASTATNGSPRRSGPPTQPLAWTTRRGCGRSTTCG